MGLFRNVVDRLRAREEPPSGPLTADGRLASDLWLDQPNAGVEIAARVRRGVVSESEGASLLHFAEQGYLVEELDIEPHVFADVEAALARLWREKPGNVAFAYQSILKPFAYADEAAHRRPSYRIADLHATCEAALGLYLHPRIHRYVELILGAAPVATQSLYFEYGSQQALHRDPVFVQTQPPSHLVAAWIALEDIHPDSGPLVYVPGSHHLPYYQLAAGEHRFDHKRHGEAEIRAMETFDRQQMEQRGLSVVPFTPRRGRVLIWHHSLLHGGSLPSDPARTRKSFVVHFSTRQNYHRLKQTYLQQVATASGVVERPRIIETERVLAAGGCAGFASPLVEHPFLPSDFFAG